MSEKQERISNDDWFLFKAMFLGSYGFIALVVLFGVVIPYFVNP